MTRAVVVMRRPCHGSQVASGTVAPLAIAQFAEAVQPTKSLASRHLPADRVDAPNTRKFTVADAARLSVEMANPAGIVRPLPRSPHRGFTTYRTAHPGLTVSMFQY